MLNISQEAMMRTVAPIPPFELQAKYERSAWSVMAIAGFARLAATGVDTIWANMLQRAFSGQLTAKWREAHIKELLVEMQHQAHALNLTMPVESLS